MPRFVAPSTDPSSRPRVAIAATAAPSDVVLYRLHEALKKGVADVLAHVSRGRNGEHAEAKPGPIHA